MSAFPKSNTGDVTTVFENPLRDEFIEEDEDYRYAYAEDFLNTYIATQIRVLRDQRGMKQEDLAKAIGTKQSGISRLENVNYPNWKTETLKKIARALGVRLRVSFETFGSLLTEDAEFSRENLKRDKFEDEPVFKKRIKPKGNRKPPQSVQRFNTASNTEIRSFKGDPAQAEFSFMYKPLPILSQPVNMHPDEDHITLEDFKDANLELAIHYFVRNVVEKEAA